MNQIENFIKKSGVNTDGLNSNFLKEASKYTDGVKKLKKILGGLVDKWDKLADQVAKGDQDDVTKVQIIKARDTADKLAKIYNSI